MAPSRTIELGAMVGALAMTAGIASLVIWRIDLERLNTRIHSKQAALKKLVVSGRIPPIQEVADYFTSRQESLQARYRAWVKAIEAVPRNEAATADPQLYFQEQLHEVQRTLERLATARKMPVPEQVGFPKEIPPSDTVVRLLGQLALVKEAAELIMTHEVVALPLLKIEDPETVTEEGSDTLLLMRLPVRVRLTCTLPHVVKILAAIDRVRPLIEVRGMRVQLEGGSSPLGSVATSGVTSLSGATAREAPATISAPGPEQLEVELLLARYTVIAPEIEASANAEGSDGATPKPRKGRTHP